MRRRALWILVVTGAVGLCVTTCRHTGVPAIDRLFLSEEEKKAFDANQDAQAAVELVKERPEVAAWLASGKQTRFSVEPDGERRWTVHAYEDVPSTGRVEGHIATFHWYRVDLATKTVTER